MFTHVYCLLYAQFEDVDLQTMIVDPSGLDYTCAYRLHSHQRRKRRDLHGPLAAGKDKAKITRDNIDIEQI